MSESRPYSMVAERSSGRRPCMAASLFRRFSMSSDKLCHHKVEKEDSVQATAQDAHFSGSKDHIMSVSDIALDKEERRIRKRRQRILKKLEEKSERRKTELSTAPGQRVFGLPNKVKPVSLFIRIGSLGSEEDRVPLEYYTAEDSSGSDGPGFGRHEPHPAAQQMRELFQKIENGSLSRTMFSEPESMYQGEGILAQFEDERKRPSSIILPRQSALKKGNQEDISKRRRSLRFLDPKDQKLYMAISHKDFLNSLSKDPTIDELIPSVEQLSFDADNNEEPTRHVRRLSSPPPPPISLERGDLADLADTERATNSDWNITEESELEGIRDIRYNLKRMPIFPRDFTSGESSDISGCEGDMEDKENRTRRGGVSAM